MTKREMYNALLSLDVVKADSNLYEAVQHELDLFNRKASAVRKPSANQLQNEVLKSAIVSYLTEVGTPKAVKELLVEVPELAGLSTSKVSALVTSLYNKGEGVLSRETIKKVNYYKVVV